ncbi:hypothetical protein [Sphingobacterium sp. JB170]|uniref:Mu transposase domain-containing protein n=1 Tax=Sphingobacterium sp. JB170 TaxID=1434842 RepID=UPI00358E3722
MTCKRATCAIPPFKLTCAEQIQLIVDKYSTISYRTNRYSVPDRLVGKFIHVKILSRRIQIFELNDIVASHERSYKTHQWVICIEHYLRTFKQKPGALSGSVALASSVYLKQLFLTHFENEARDFIDLLDYCHKNQINNEQLEAVVNRLNASGVRQLSTEMIIVLLGNQSIPTPPIPFDHIAHLSKKQLSEQTSLLN